MSKNEVKSQLFRELASERSNIMFYHHRKATFKKWCFDNKNAHCSSEALAKAGFFFSGCRTEPSAATCAFCLKEMDFEENDDPWIEHQAHSKICSFVELDKLEEKDWTVRDFIFLLAGRIAAEQRKAMLHAAEKFETAAAELEVMATKTLNSIK